MFNRHQAEITVLQFRGHSLPVHHSVVYNGNFSCLSHFISQFPPTQFPLLTAIGMCHFLLVHHLGIAFFGPGRRSKHNSYKLVDRCWGWLKRCPFNIYIPRCSGGRYSFPWIAPLTLNLYLMMLSKVASSTIYWVLSMTRLNPDFPEYWRTLTYFANVCVCICVCVCVCVCAVTKTFSKL